jgi:hypothetical protein
MIAPVALDVSFSFLNFFFAGVAEHRLVAGPDGYPMIV